MTEMIWLGLLALFIVIEIATVGLTSIWFAGGSVAALIAYLFGVGMIGQIAAFLIVSFVLLFSTRPLAVRFLNQNHTKTNCEALIGKVIRIGETVNNLDQTGNAVVNGQPWTVRAADDSVIIKEGEFAKVCSISGVKLIVTPCSEEEKPL